MGLPQPTRAALIATGVADSATVKHDRTKVVAAPGVLANDLHLLGSSSAVLVSGVSNGTLNLRSDGGYTYIPASGFVGTDSFRYKPSGLLSTAARVTITVTNALPVAGPDAYTWAGGTLTVGAPGVLTNDTDADGDALLAELDGGGISGSFDLDENGGFRYTPGGGFSGSGTVSYRVWDGVAWSATTTIRLTRQTPTATPTPTPTPTPPSTPRPTPSPRCRFPAFRSRASRCRYQSLRSGRRPRPARPHHQTASRDRHHHQQAHQPGASPARQGRPPRPERSRLLPTADFGQQAAHRRAPNCCMTVIGYNSRPGDSGSWRGSTSGRCRRRASRYPVCSSSCGWRYRQGAPWPGCQRSNGCVVRGARCLRAR